MMKHRLKPIALAVSCLAVPNIAVAQAPPHTCGANVEIVSWIWGRDTYDVVENELSVGMGFSRFPQKDRVLSFVVSKAQKVRMVSFWRASRDSEEVPLPHALLREDGSKLASTGSAPYRRHVQMIYDVSPGKYCVFLPGVEGAKSILGSFRPS